MDSKKQVEYVNGFSVKFSYYEAVIEFFVEGLDENNNPEKESVASVRMSPQLVKSLIDILGGNMSKYEEQFGKIPMIPNKITLKHRGDRMGNAIEEEDYRGRKVICTDRTWNEHIVSGHEIMKKNKEAVIDTIQNPDSVYVSSTNPSRDVYFKQSNKSTYSLFTKVIVENKLEIGEVVL